MLIRNKPKLSYCGLTIVMSNPSRLDLKVGGTNLLTGNGGMFFAELLKPHYNIYQCDIRVKEDKNELLPNTRCVLLLGEDAAQDWLNNKDNSLGEIRGTVFHRQGLPHVCSFLPQDAVDIKDLEGEHNPLLKEHESDNDDEDDEDTALSDKRRHGKTRRKNYRFWLRKDVERCIHIIQKGVPIREKEPQYIIYPSSTDVIKELTSHKNEDFYFDKETDDYMQMQCFSFSFGYDGPIYCVPVFDHTYNWAYHSLPNIYKALQIAFSNNTGIAYNGHTFDFLHLARKCRIAIGPKTWDPMLAFFRCYPEVERSLGHAMSLWTWEPFHKDEGSSGYVTVEQVKQRLQYCGKDVYGMKCVKKSILEYASRRPGLTESIEQTMDTIRPYLLPTLQGIKFFEEDRKAIMHENDRFMIQYLRIINLLIGEKTCNELYKRFKSALPASNPQCCLYFHDLLGYPIVGRGKVRKDGTRGPSLAKKNIFRLRLKHNNPILDLVIQYRELAKESGSLKFTPLINE